MSTSNLSSDLQPPPPGGNRYTVNIAAYVRLSFSKEVELTGYIGEAAFTAESKSSFRGLEVAGDVGGMSAELKIGRRRFRALPVNGEVMGQPVEGSITTKAGDVTFVGKAGLEPLRYQLDARGVCSNRTRDLGLNVVYQAFYSEITGTVERVPDAAMIGLLLPVRLFEQDPM